MTFAFDGSSQMWSTLSVAGGLAFMFGYGVFRREHTRVWPILFLGLVLDVTTQLWFVPRYEGNEYDRPGMYLGLLLYPMYATVAAVAGIMLRVCLEYAFEKISPRKKVGPAVEEYTVDKPYVPPIRDTTTGFREEDAAQMAKIKSFD